MSAPLSDIQVVEIASFVAVPAAGALRQLQPLHTFLNPGHARQTRLSVKKDPSTDDDGGGGGGDDDKKTVASASWAGGLSCVTVAKRGDRSRCDGAMECGGRRPT